MLFTLTSKIIKYMNKINKWSVIWNLIVFPFLMAFAWHKNLEVLVIWVIVFKVCLINAYQTPEDYIKK